MSKASVYVECPVCRQTTVLSDGVNRRGEPVMRWHLVTWRRCWGSSLSVRAAAEKAEKRGGDFRF